MKKLLLILIFSGLLTDAFAQCTRLHLTDWNQCGRTRDGFYNVELGNLDSFANNGGIPVTMASTTPPYNDSTVLDSIKWYTNNGLFDQFGVPALVDQNTGAGWLESALKLAILPSVQPAYQTVLGEALYDAGGLDWYSAEIKDYLTGGMNTTLGQINTNTFNAAANTGTLVTSNANISLGITNVNSKLTQTNIKLDSIKYTIQQTNKQLLQPVTVVTVTATGTTPIAADEILIGGFTTAANVKLTAADVTGTNGIDIGFILGAIPPQANPNGFAAMISAHTVTAVNTCVLFIIKLQ